MNKPIEEKVKLIVENNEYLTLKEKSDIICLIECYKGADKTAQKLAKENESLKDRIIKSIEYKSFVVSLFLSSIFSIIDLLYFMFISFYNL